MPIKIKKILWPVDSKLEELSGRVVTKDNIVSIANWIPVPAEPIFTVKKNGEESNHRVKILTVKGDRTAKIGDGIFRRGKGDWFVVSAKELARLIKL